MEEIPTHVLRDLVDELERTGEQTIAVETILARLQLPALVDAQELAWLREIEAVARRMVATPLWQLRGPAPGDAEELRRLILGPDTPVDPLA